MRVLVYGNRIMTNSYGRMLEVLSVGGDKPSDGTDMPHGIDGMPVNASVNTPTHAPSMSMQQKLEMLLGETPNSTNTHT